MTQYIEFLFKIIADFMNTIRGFEFEFFGIQTNFLYVLLSFIVVSIFITFIRMGISTTSEEVVHESVQHRLKLNRQREKQNQEIKQAQYSKDTRGGKWV
ncbi:MAG: hypothetical protein ACI4OT_00280 [Bacilli bacterium]